MKRSLAPRRFHDGGDAVGILFHVNDAMFVEDRLVAQLAKLVAENMRKSMLFEHLAALAAAEGRAIVYATHDFNLAARFSTHALVFAHEARVLTGSADALLRAEILSASFGFRLCEQAAAGRKVFLPRW